MKPFVKLARHASRNNVRRASTSAGETAGAATFFSKTMLEVPAWSLVGMGAAAAGFFGKMLHDDNLETRRELQSTRHDLHEDNKQLRAEIKQDSKELRAEIKQNGKELRAEMKQDIRTLGEEMKTGFKKLDEAIASFSVTPK